MLSSDDYLLDVNWMQEEFPSARIMCPHLVIVPIADNTERRFNEKALTYG